MPECFVFIYLPGQIEALPAGKLSFGCDSVAFAYGNRYLQNPSRISVDPILHGFLLENGRLSLSPAFDVTPPPARPGVSTIAYQAMTVGTLAGREANLDNARSACSRFGLKPEEAERLIADMLRACSGAWEASFARHGVSSADKKFFAHTFGRWSGANDYSDKGC